MWVGESPGSREGGKRGQEGLRSEADRQAGWWLAEQMESAGGGRGAWLQHLTTVAAVVVRAGMKWIAGVSTVLWCVCVRVYAVLRSNKN